MRIIAIDPGIAHTGLVYMDEHEIFAACTLKTSKPKNSDITEVHERLHTLEAELLAWIANKPHEVVVIEDFVYYGSRNNCFTYKTPYLCGYLDRALREENVIWQDAPTVLSHRSKKSPVHSNSLFDAHLLARDLVRTFRGAGEILKAPKTTAEHMVSAFLHGLYYLREAGCDED